MTVLIVVAIAIVLSVLSSNRRCPECGSKSLCDDDCTAPIGRWR